MELKDYVAVLRRYWPTWVGITVAGLLIALAVVQLSPRTYQATAQVFVASSASSSSPQFVAQRVKSYPDVAVSAAVLGPAGEQLADHPSLRELRGQVSATNPADTSQINIVATSSDPETAAATANAVAEQFTGVVEGLEKPANGDSPVTLTVTNPATAPTGPVSPQALYVFALGLMVGLFFGLAAAIVRSRVDTAVHDEAGVRRAWGPEPVQVLTTPRRKARPGRLAGRPAAVLARRLEVLADSGQARVSFLAPSPGEQPAASALAGEVAAELDRLEVSSAVAGPAGRPGAPLPRVAIEIAEPLASLRAWRSLAASTDGVVLVVPTGRVLDGELQAMASLLREADLVPLAVVLTPRPSRAPWRRSRTRAHADATGGGRGGDGTTVGRPVEGPVRERLLAGTSARPAAPATLRR
jgi:capsular polysaccharide biosynthesis protein